jgi:hypothetical protein
MGDQLIQNFPLSSWIAFGSHPFVAATTRLDAMSQDLIKADEQILFGQDNYIAPFNLLCQVIGTEPVNSRDVNAAETFYKAWYSHLPEEQRAPLIKQAMAIDSTLREADPVLNQMLLKGEIPGKSFWQDIKKHLMPTMKVQTEPPPQYEMSPEEIRLRNSRTKDSQ